MTVNDDYDQVPEWERAMADHPLPEWLPAIERVDPLPQRGEHKVRPWAYLLGGAVVVGAAILGAAWVTPGPPKPVVVTSDANVVLDMPHDARWDVRYIDGETTEYMVSKCDADGGELIYDPHDGTWTCEGVGF